MSLTRTTADEALKEDYQPGMREVLNSKVFILSQVEMNDQDVEGRRAVLSINTGRNHGVGARAEGGTLPTAGNQSYSEQRVPLKYNYGRIEISGPVMRSMGSDRGSFVRAVDSETRGVVRDLKNNVNRQCYGGGTGAIGTVSGANTTVAVPIEDNTTTFYRQLEVGMVIDIGLVSDPTEKASALTIVSIDLTPGSEVMTLSAAPGTATEAADVIFVSGSGGADGGVGQKEITGLAAQISDTGALWNIDPSTVGRVWQSYVNDNGGTNRAVAETMFTRAQMEVGINSGEEIDLWVTTDGVHRGVSNLLTSIKRFPQTTELKGGYSGLDMSSVSQGNDGSNTVVLTYDKDCTGNTAYGLCTKRIQHYRMADWEFMQEDGSVLSRVAGKDAYEATLFTYHELATDARNAHAVIQDLTES